MTQRAHRALPIDRAESHRPDPDSPGSSQADSSVEPSAGPAISGPAALRRAHRFRRRAAAHVKRSRLLWALRVVSVTLVLVLGGSAVVALERLSEGPASADAAASEPAPAAHLVIGGLTVSATSVLSDSSTRVDAHRAAEAAGAQAAAERERQRQAAAAAAALKAREAAQRARIAREAARNPRGLGQMMAAERGWTGKQWRCLDLLWHKESKWKVRADNPTSSAYGIPQALPGSKMSSAGRDWRTNPATQIRWGLGYIASRYGTPCAAWSHSQSHNWY